MRLFLKAILILTLTATILLPVALLFAISDHAPLAKPAPAVTPALAQEFKQIAKQMQFAIYYVRSHTLIISARQADALFAIAARALPRLSGEAQMTDKGSELRATLHLPENPFGNYINLRLGLPAVSQGLEVDYLSIGRLTLHGKSAHWVMKELANLAFGGNEGTKLLTTIKQIKSQRERLIITYQPTPHLDEKLVAALKRLQPWRDESTTPNSAAIRDYYRQLCSNRSAITTSLNQPLSAMFALAATRNSSAQVAATENRAALLAMAIYFGTYRFNTIVNAIPDETIKQCQHERVEATLAGRKDMALHFIYSAAIKILTDSHTSFAVGELKEMLDSLQGGSGFSFADLAADQSGIRFAELASEPRSARQLQQTAAQLTDERYFFPDISQLPEAISQPQFDRQYGDGSGEFYNQLLDAIKNAIDALPIHRAVQ